MVEDEERLIAENRRAGRGDVCVGLGARGAVVSVFVDVVVVRVCLGRRCWGGGQLGGRAGSCGGLFILFGVVARVGRG